jgi:hypothetical protein
MAIVIGPARDVSTSIAAPQLERPFWILQGALGFVSYIQCVKYGPGSRSSRARGV